MDRTFKRMLNTPASGHSKGVHPFPTSALTSGHPPKTSMRFERLLRSRAFSYLKGPLLQARNFLTAPVLNRIDNLNNVLSTHQRLLAQSIDRLQALEADVILKFEALHQKSDAAIAKLDTLGETVGFLHQKADDAAIKLRPAIHLKDAYAVPLRDGYLFVPEEDEGLLLMYTGAGPDGLEPGTRRILRMISPPGGSVIDVGASVGLHTLAFARAVGPAGRIFAFEAEPRLEHVLRRTLHANGMGNVNLQILAVGAEHGEAQFHVARTIGHSSLYALPPGEEVREEVRVKLRTLDELIPRDVQIDVIKIDVEGAELDVLKGAQDTISRSAGCAIIAELGPSHLDRTGTRLEDWIAFFTKYGLIGFSIQEPFGNVKSLNVEWLKQQHSVNIIFVREDSFALSALEKAK